MSVLPLITAAVLATSGDPAAASSAAPQPDTLVAVAAPMPGMAASPAAIPSTSPGARRASSASLPKLGLMLTGGLPDGGVVSLVYRPIRWVRVDGGVSYNALSLGAQGGVTFVPFHWGLVPTLRLEGGRSFRSDVNDKVSRWGAEVPTYLQPALHGFGYDYASAQLGLEVGSQRRFVFFLRGGLAWVRGEFGDGENLHDASSPGTTVDVKGLRISATGPTASLGFLFYVW